MEKAKTERESAVAEERMKAQWERTKGLTQENSKGFGPIRGFARSIRIGQAEFMTLVYLSKSSFGALELWKLEQRTRGTGTNVSILMGRLL